MLTGYNMTEYGIYAKVETDEEILLAIATAQVADYIPTKNISPLSILVDMYIKLQQISDIKFEYSIPSGFYTPLSLFNEKNKELERTVDGIISTVTSIKHCTLTVSGWIAHSNLFKQEVQVDKMLSDYSPILIKTLSGSESPSDVKTYCKAFNLIFAGETAAGKVIFYAYKKPERDIVVGLKGV